MSPSLIEANLVVRARMVAMWNLFWCDCVLRNGGQLSRVDRGERIGERSCSCERG
jgi:hypothetical protein